MATPEQPRNLQALLATHSLDLEGGTIYGLIDPETRELRYIGKTSKSIRTRFNAHLNEARTSPSQDDPRIKWIRGLLGQDREPDVVILSEPERQKSLSEAERHWIVVAESTGGFLVNKITYVANETLSNKRRFERIEEQIARLSERVYGDRP